MFGLGGVFIEFMKDVSFKLIPLRKKDAKKMIGEIKSKEILNGARGFPKVNILNLEKILLDLSKFVEANPEIEEVDLNPIIANEKTIIAVDARIVLRK
jgi:acyl-CoA synthetase (NDP forming)